MRAESWTLGQEVYDYQDVRKDRRIGAEVLGQKPRDQGRGDLVRAGLHHFLHHAGKQ